MKQLKLKILDAVVINFATASIALMRETSTTKLIAMGYTNGTGQTITAGQVFYTVGTPGSTGYIKVSSANNATLTGSGNIALTVEALPSSTVADGLVTITILGKPAYINFDYSSTPVISNIVLEIPNRLEYTFKPSDFTSNVYSFDSAALDAINLQGTMTNYTFNGAALLSGTWITIQDIGLGKLKYTPLNQDTAYEATVDYKARDVNGNESTN